jgi:DNA-binding PadR family transcriptional regulator
MPRVFGHGGLRLVLLSLLEDGARTGYELIVALEERFLGMYRPSSGTVYPRLGALEEEGLVTSAEEDGKKVYRITDAGREELARRRAELEDAVSSATTTVRAVIDDLQTDIRAAVAAVQTEVRRQASATGDARQVADEVRRAAKGAASEARRASEEARRIAMDEARRVRRLADDLRRQARRDRHGFAFDWDRGWGHSWDNDDARDDAREDARGTRDELDELVAEVATWAGEAVDQLRRHLPDEAQRARLRDALSDAKRAFIDTLTGSDRA